MNEWSKITCELQEQIRRFTAIQFRLLRVACLDKYTRTFGADFGSNQEFVIYVYDNSCHPKLVCNDRLCLRAGIEFIKRSGRM